MIWYALLLLLIISIIFLPKILKGLGLHPSFKGRTIDLTGKRVLFVTTSQGVLEPKKKATGVFPSELTVPYYAFLDAGMQVDLASIKGGKIPLEEYGMKWPIATAEDKRALKDPDFQLARNQSTCIDHLDVSQYDLVFIPGGWGAAYDLGFSEVLGQKVSEAWANGAVIGAICHGPLGLLKAKDVDGSPLLDGKKATAVTNKQVKQLGVTFTPQHPEEELRKAGADFQCGKAVLDLFANKTVVDGRLVTGQNQNAGHECAQRMMELLSMELTKKEAIPVMEQPHS